MKLSRTDRFFQGIGPVGFIAEVSESGMPKNDPVTAWDGTLFELNSPVTNCGTHHILDLFVDEE